MTRKTNENELFLAWLPKTYYIYFSPLLKLLHLHFQKATVSKIANSTSVTDTVSWLEKVYCTGVSMPGKKSGRRSPTFISWATENLTQRQPSAGTPASSNVSLAEGLDLHVQVAK